MPQIMELSKPAEETFTSTDDVIYWNNDMPTIPFDGKVESSIYNDFIYDLNWRYCNKNLCSKSFDPQVEYTQAYVNLKSIFYNDPVAKKAALSHLLDLNKKAVETIAEMKLWKRKLYYIHTTDVSEEDIVSYVASLGTFDNARWTTYDYVKPKTMLAENNDPYKGIVWWHKKTNDGVIDTQILVDWNMDSIYDYLNNTYYKTAIVFSDVAIDDAKDGRLKKVNFTFDELKGSTKKLSIPELIMKKHADAKQVKIYGSWKKIYYKNDEAYYKYNGKKYMICRRDIDKLCFK